MLAIIRVSGHFFCSAGDPTGASGAGDSAATVEDSAAAVNDRHYILSSSVGVNRFLFHVALHGN